MRTEWAMEAALSAEAGDSELCSRILEGERELFEILVRRHNRSLYRAVRSILRDEGVVEEVMQEAWVSAYEHLASFRGESRFSTWLIRIGIHAALAHRRRDGRWSVEENGERHPARAPDPETDAARRQLLSRVKRAVDGLPPAYRSVLLLRQVEGLDTQETATALGIQADAVKTRLHRARTMLKSLLDEDLLVAFPFDGPRCERLTDSVLVRITRH